MSIRRAALAVLSVLALVALYALSRPDPAPPPPPAPAFVGAPVQGQPTVSSVPADDSDAWRRRAARVSDRCRVETHTLCAGASCATVAHLPDLDSVRGWMSLGWHNPGLVAASLLGDHGIAPAGGWPCHDAIEAFLAGSPTDVRIGEGPGGTWVVCVASGGELDRTDAPCASAAQALGLPWTGVDPQRQL